MEKNKGQGSQPEPLMVVNPLHVAILFGCFLGAIIGQDLAMNAKIDAIQTGLEGARGIVVVPKASGHAVLVPKARRDRPL